MIKKQIRMLLKKVYGNKLYFFDTYKINHLKKRKSILFWDGILNNDGKIYSK